MAEISNVPQDSNFEYKQGTTLVVTLVFKRTPTTFFDLTNYNVQVTVRKQYGSDDYVIYATSESSGPGANKVVISDALNGEAEWTIIPADTTGFEWDGLDTDTVDLPYDVELHRTTNGIVYSPIRGTLTLVREVTR